jgi:oxygen-independent coproporphyrinogen-3 oxidase
MDFEKGERRYWECEVLSEEDRYNEMVMLGLRTREGVKLEDVPERFRGHCEEKALPYLEKQWLKQVGGRLVATNEGIHVLNRVIEDLMV